MKEQPGAGVVKTPAWVCVQGSAATQLTRREIISAAAFIAAASLIPGCSSGTGATAINMEPPATPINPQPIPSNTLTPASLTVTASPAGTVGPNFAGLSYEKFNMTEPFFTAANSDLIGLFKTLGTSLLRIGGNSVESNVWTPNGSGQTAGQIAPSDVDNLAAFLQVTGWQCLYGINLAGAATGTTNSALAAEEVAYVYQKLGNSLYGIEIGNEPDLYGNAGNAYAGNWSLSQFLTLWGEFRTAIVSLTPNVTITGPADASDVSTWTIPFAQVATKNEIGLLTQHYYLGSSSSSSATVQNTILPNPTLLNELATLQAGGQSIGVPYRVAECNAYYNSSGSIPIMGTYAVALWVIDFLFNCAQAGSSGVNFHGGGSGYDHAPIIDTNGVVSGAALEYYGILLFTLAGQGTLYTTEISVPGGLSVTAYAVKSPAGGLNLIVNNKDGTNSLDLSIALPQAASSATLLEMTQLSSGASLSATSGVTIQGATVAMNGAFLPNAPYTLSPSGNQLTCYVPALSAVLIQVAG